MRPTLVVNPATDAAFVRFAQLIVDHGVIPITEFERRLRLEYPRAVAHKRQLSGERTVIWYVYRDGHWINSAPIADKTGGQEPDAQP